MSAQYWHETGGGKFCFDWNFGNQKAANANRYHMYLKNVWECFSAAEAQQQVQRANGRARIPTPDEARQHGWSCPDTIVVFSPPSPQCRFLAFASLEDALHSWCDRMRTIASSNGNFLGQLNSADLDGVASSLARAHYYTDSEQSYARGLESAKAMVDRILG